VRVLAPCFEFIDALANSPTVFIVGDVVDQPHVRVQREHCRALGLGQELQTVIKILGLRAREVLAIRARACDRANPADSFGGQHAHADFSWAGVTTCLMRAATAPKTNRPFCQRDSDGRLVSVS